MTFQLNAGNFTSVVNTSNPSFHETEFSYQAATKQDNHLQMQQLLGSNECLHYQVCSSRNVHI